MTLESLRGKTLVVVGLFLVLFGVVFAGGAAILTAHDHDGVLVNLSGRQRMLGQRIAKESLSLHLSPSADKSESLTHTVEVFSRTLTALEKGGEAPLDVDMTSFVELDAESDVAISTQWTRVRAAWLPVQVAAESLVASNGRDKAALDTVVGSNLELLDVTDAAVSMLQARADARVTSLLGLQIFSLLAGILLTAGSLVFLRKTVVSPASRAASAANRLGDGDLETAVKVDGSTEFSELAKSLERVRLSLREKSVEVRLLANANSKLEEANQALDRRAGLAVRAKTEFLAVMSHELRTPMNAVLGFTDLAAKRGAKVRRYVEDQPDACRAIDKQFHYLAQIREAADDLLNLINGVLDLSKIESGEMEITVEDCHMYRLVDGVALAMQPLIDKNENVLKIDVGDEVQPVRTDVAKVRRCLMNLVGNAAKFTEGGTITITVREEEIDEVDVTVISVKDTGVGLTDEQKKTIFESFTQGDSSTTRRFGGVGMGLALVKHMMELLGGSVEVWSEMHRGSTFTMRFPTRAKQQTSVAAK